MLIASFFAVDAVSLEQPNAPSGSASRNELVNSDDLANGQPVKRSRKSEPGVGLVTRSKAASDMRGLRSVTQAREKRKSEFEGVVITKRRRSHHGGPTSASSTTKKKAESPAVPSAAVDLDGTAEVVENIVDSENVANGGQGKPLSMIEYSADLH
jgi:hypothetical protein